MLPLSLLRTAKGHPMLVELKNGETYNGHLASCDTWMNIHLQEVICTSRDGTRFFQMRDCYLRGNTVKYLRIPDVVLDKVKEENEKLSKERQAQGGVAGRGRGGLGRGGQRGGRGGQRGGFRGGRGGAPRGGGRGGRGGYNQNQGGFQNNQNQLR